MTTTTHTPISLFLGYINPSKIKFIFDKYGYTEEENENGYFLQVQGNQQHGVSIYTNYFQSKKRLKKHLFNALLISL